MIKYNIKLTLLFIASTFLVFAACKKQATSDIPIEEENELITTVSIMFIDTIAQDTFNYRWSQPGGPGSAITVDTIKLKVNTNYMAYTTILDESKTPTLDVSAEIRADANSHRFVYSSTTTRLNTLILDQDAQIPPMELGLIFAANTTNVGDATGKFKVMLKHYTASSPKSGGLANGSTDIEVEFALAIQ